MRAANELGAEGRQAAADYLTERGITVLDRNWSCPDATIPIIAEEGRTLVVVEVVGAGNRYHTPLERAAKARRSRLRRASVRWLADHGRRYDQIRVDVIGLIREGGGGFAIEHVRAVG
jgi:putative endonuclease